MCNIPEGAAAGHWVDAFVEQDRCADPEGRSRKDVQPADVECGQDARDPVSCPVTLRWRKPWRRRPRPREPVPGDGDPGCCACGGP